MENGVQSGKPALQPSVLILSRSGGVGTFYLKGLYFYSVCQWRESTVNPIMGTLILAAEIYRTNQHLIDIHSALAT